MSDAGQERTDYEIRLYGASGGLRLLYVTNSINEEHVRQCLDGIRDIDYTRFEIWQGYAKVADGLRPEPSHAA
jgi:hypothetical protein